MTSIDHPFNVSLSDLSHEELERRYSDLLRRWQVARRMQMDQSILHQLDLLLNGVEIEKERRATLEEKPNGSILETDPIQITKHPTQRKR
jgi:plasmid stabilization system protein ParE